MIFGPSTISDLTLGGRKEWIETNGIGGYASSTIVGMNTRRYHGLLLAATKPPVGRFNLVGKIEETVRVRGRAYELTTNQYPGVIYPTGYRLQREFRLDPWPTFVFAVEGLAIEKCVFMVQGENTTVITYRLMEDERAEVKLALVVLAAFRDFHTLTRANATLNGSLKSGPGWVCVAPYDGVPPLYLNHSNAEVSPGGDWYYRYQYERERERGLDFEEDLYHVCTLAFDLTGAGVALVLSTEQRETQLVEAWRSSERLRRSRLTCGWERFGSFAQALIRASDQFIVRRGESQRTIIAGYHWFGDWTRDTMIALPGLVLVPRCHQPAAEILRSYAEYCSQGMLPNRFPESGGEPEYNTVDATLWFVQAIYEFVLRTKDYAFVKEHLYATVLDIIRWHAEGTRFNIRMGPDGLLDSGAPATALTWMDARVGRQPVTPRLGKPVEIQALWYNALRIVQHLAQTFGDRHAVKHHADLAENVRHSFLREFWNDDASCLYDCITDGQADPSMRPNQILAASLPFSMLSPPQLKHVTEAVTRELLTPFGLRSLSPKDPRYQGRYQGDSAQRDAAYHQGTVWSWLMGPYITSRLRVSGHTPSALLEARALLSALESHLRESGLGSISEIFDGDPPHEPRGCIAQAWSVAELLRVLVDELGVEKGETGTFTGRDSEALA